VVNIDYRESVLSRRFAIFFHRKSSFYWDSYHCEFFIFFRNDAI